MRDVEGHPLVSKARFGRLAWDLEYERREVSTSSGRLRFAVVACGPRLNFERTWLRMPGFQPVDHSVEFWTFLGFLL